MIERVSAVIPAGGAVGGGYAASAGTTVRCLAPLGPNRVPVLAFVVKALKDSSGVDKIVVAAPDEAHGAVEGVDDWREAGATGPQSIRNALEAIRGEDRVLICASDLPLIRPESIAEFLKRASPDADVTIGLVRAARYESEFPNSPPSTYVALHDAGPVTIGCVFIFKCNALERSWQLLDACFAARKSLVQTASLLGPAVIARLLTGRLSLKALIERGTDKTGLAFDILTDVAPDLAYDIDTLGDYEYADSYIGRRERG